MARLTLQAQIHTITDTKSPDLTEDTYLALHNGETITLMVVDGAPQRLKTGGTMRPMLDAYGADTAPGRYAAYLARDMAAAAAACTPQQPLRDIALGINQRLRENLEAVYGGLTAQAVLAHEPDLAPLREDPRLVRLILPVACITLARIDLLAGTLEYAHGGDTALFALYRDGRTVQVTPDQMGPHDDRMRAKMREVLRATDTRDLAELRARFDEAFAINTYNGIYHNYEDEQGGTDPSVGVGVINGMPQFGAYLMEGRLAMEELDGILLASDGFIWPAPLDESPQQAEARVDRMGQMIREQGLRAYLDAQRAEEHTDQNGDRYQHFGLLDDATAIYVPLIHA